MTDQKKLERAEREAAAEAASRARTDAEEQADAAVDRQAALDNDEPEDGPSSADYSVAFSPRNLAVGLAIVAGLVAIAARRHRRRREG